MILSYDFFRGHPLRIVVGLMMLILMLAGEANAAILTVDDSGGANYTRIQDAIDVASAGDIILVYSGTYFETVVVNKKLELIGQDNGAGMPIVNAVGMGDVITITADRVILNGFYAKNCGPYCKGIIVTSNNNLIINNKASDNDIGISLLDSHNNTLSDNNLSNSYEGISLSGSANNTINNNIAKSVSYAVIQLASSNNNNISNNNFSQSGVRNWGILLRYSDSNIIKNNNASNTIIGGEFSDFNVLDSNFFKSNDESHHSSGISLSYSSNNIITNNFITNIGISNNAGISLYLSNNFTIIGNAIDSKSNGIYLKYSHNNTININSISSNRNYGIYLDSSIKNDIYNNFLNNTNNFYLADSENNWNTSKMIGNNIVDGIYLGGNFWANPSGKGFSQTCIDSEGDGICDSSYSLDSYNIDYLPLAYRFISTPTANVSISGSSFQPQTINVAAGTTVTWTNLDSVAHTVTSDTGLFDSGSLSTGQTFSRIFNTAGSYDYHCSIHPSMTGSVIVTSDNPPPASISNPQASMGTTWINWSWNNPLDTDFSHVKLHLNGTFLKNITSPQNFVNITGLSPDMLYELGTHTVDTSGNVNQTWVNKTARTVPIDVTPVVNFPGMTNPPTDSDGDGLYEDINGNGRKDFNDVVLFFNYLEWVAVNQPISSFDFNGNGRIDFNDIIKLFEEL